MWYRNARRLVDSHSVSPASSHPTHSRVNAKRYSCRPSSLAAACCCCRRRCCYAACCRLSAAARKTLRAVLSANKAEYWGFGCYPEFPNSCAIGVNTSPLAQSVMPIRSRVAEKIFVQHILLPEITWNLIDYQYGFPTKFCIMVKTSKYSSRVIPKCAPEIQHGRGPQFLKKWKIVIRQQLFDNSNDVCVSMTYFRQGCAF